MHSNTTQEEVAHGLAETMESSHESIENRAPLDNQNPQTTVDNGQSDMVIGGLWFLGGTLVTGCTYAMASGQSGGGSYVVAWGAILFGGLQFLAGLIRSMR